MAHEIEIVNGVASFAENGLKERAWHKLGQVFDRPMTVKEALEASHADYEVNLQNIVMMTPAIQDAMAKGSVPTDLLLDALIKGKKATMRTDKNAPLGIVSENYGVVQNIDAFTFVDTLCTGGVTDHAPVIECAGVLGKGERVFITAKFPEDIILDNKGDDRVEMYMVFTTSHDGMGAVRCIVCPTRVVCNNTLQFALNNNRGSIALRHSSNIMQRLDLNSKENVEFAFKSLNLMKVYKQSLESRFETLRNLRLMEKEIDEVIAGINLSDEALAFYKEFGIEYDQIPTQSRNRFYAMKNAVESGIGQDYGERGTGMWLMNGITSYYQNNANYRSSENKFDSILTGNVSKKVLEACEMIMS